MGKSEHTPTGTAVEKFTDEDGLKHYGFLGWFICMVKSEKTHESRRNQRRRERSQKAEKKKQANGSREPY